MLIDACDEIPDEWMDEFDDDVCKVGAAMQDQYQTRHLRQTSSVMS